MKAACWLGKLGACAQGAAVGGAKAVSGELLFAFVPQLLF